MLDHALVQMRLPVNKFLISCAMSCSGSEFSVGIRDEHASGMRRRCDCQTARGGGSGSWDSGEAVGRAVVVEEAVDALEASLAGC